MSMNTILIPPDTPQTSPRHPPDISREHKSQQTTTDANRHCQTYSNSTCQCLGVSGTVCLCLLAPVVVFWHLVFIGYVWGVSWGCLGRFLGRLSGIHGNWRRLDVFGWYLGSQSLQNGAITLFWQNPERHNFSSLDRIETSKY